MNRWTLVAVAGLLMLTMTAALAQVGLQPCPQVMTVEERARLGYTFSPETREWYAPDQTGTVRVEETGRFADTTFPDWTFDQETGRWHDEARPGWTFDPLADRWHHEDRPGQVYDLRTGIWLDETMDQQRVQRGFDFDEQRNRWYDYGGRFTQRERQGVSTFYEPDTGRWRTEPMDFRWRDEQGRPLAGH